MYMHTLFACVLMMLSISGSACGPIHPLNKTSFHVTALYYVDNLGISRLISGSLPLLTNLTLQRILREGAPVLSDDVQFGIRSLFNNSDDIPTIANREYIEGVRNSYQNVYFTKLNENITRDLINEMRRRGDAKRVQMLRDDETPDATEPTEQEETTENAKELNGTRLLSSHKDFLPNSIYYAIEKKCTNWSDDCDENSPLLGRFGNEAARLKIGAPPLLGWGK